MNQKTRITIDHNEIKEWVVKHGGKPALIMTPQGENGPIGLRIDFSGKEDEAMLSRARTSDITSWERFFEIFEMKNLAFRYQDKPKLQNPTLAYRFIYRDILFQNNAIT